MRITLLGTGASTGVPLIGCACAVCTSNDPRNRRSRVSALVEVDGTQLLIDTSPDLRTQALASGIRMVDAILYTHAHADHVHGIDDVRSFNHHRNSPIPAYADAATLQELQQRFPYAFKSPISQFGWFRPCLEPQIISAGIPFSAAGITVLPIAQTHGKTTTLGYRIGAFAYSTDVNVLSDEALNQLRGIDTWVVDCLRPHPAPTHAHLELTLQWIAHVAPRRAILTHMSHDFDYTSLAATLPTGVEPGWDGMVLEVGA